MEIGAHYSSILSVLNIQSNITSGHSKPDLTNRFLNLFHGFLGFTELAHFIHILLVTKRAFLWIFIHFS